MTEYSTMYMCTHTHTPHGLDIGNNAAIAMNTGVQISLQDPDLLPLDVHRNVIGESDGSSIFKYLNNFHTISPSSFTNLDSQK